MLMMMMSGNFFQNLKKKNSKTKFRGRQNHWSPTKTEWSKKSKKKKQERNLLKKLFLICFFRFHFRFRLLLLNNQPIIWSNDIYKCHLYVSFIFHLIIFRSLSFAFYNVKRKKKRNEKLIDQTNRNEAIDSVECK